MWINVDNRIRMNVWTNQNTSSYAVIYARIETVGAQSVTLTSGTMTVNGTRYNVSGSSSSRGDAEEVYSPGNVTVYYGGSSSISVGVSCSVTYAYDSGGTIITGVSASGSGTYTETKPITVAISTSASSVNLGSAINITTSGGGSSASTVAFKVGSTTVESVSKGNTTWSWTPTMANYANRFSSSSASLTCTITWNGVSTNVTLKLPQNSNTKPTCSVALSIKSGTGLGTLYVKSKTQAVITVSSLAGKYNATVKSYSIAMNGETFTGNYSGSGNVTATTAPLGTAGTNTCTVTITDTRGFTGTATATVSVSDYSPPSLTNVSIYRSNSSGVADSISGTYFTYKADIVITSLTNNAKKYTLQYKLNSSSSWSNAQAATNLTNYSQSINVTKTITGGFLTTALYDVRIMVEDSFETVYSTNGTIPTASVIMDFNSAGTGGGIGMYTQAANYLDVAWKIRARDGINIPWTGTGVTSTTYLAVFDSNKNIVPMNKDYIPGGGGGSNVEFTKFNQSNTKSGVGTSYVYSGVSVTIPANSYYMFRFAAWKESSVNPAGIVLASSSTSLTADTSQQEKLAGTSGYQVEDVYCDYTESSGVTWYLWIKAASSTTLGFRIKGWYMRESS